MDSKEFLRRCRRYARKTGQSFEHDKGHGKGSHSRVYIGARYTTMKDGEFGPGLFNKMLKDLGVKKPEF